MPVLPDVASISVSPGLMSQRFSASAIIDNAGRSLTDPAGLLPSIFPRMTLDVDPGSRCRRTSGVFPIVDSSVGYITPIVLEPSSRLGCAAPSRSRDQMETPPLRG